MQGPAETSSQLKPGDYEVNIQFTENKRSTVDNLAPILDISRKAIVEKYQVPVSSDEVQFCQVTVKRNGIELNPQEANHFFQVLNWFSPLPQHASLRSDPEGRIVNHVLNIGSFNQFKVDMEPRLIAAPENKPKFAHMPASEDAPNPTFSEFVDHSLYSLHMGNKYLERTDGFLAYLFSDVYKNKDDARAKIAALYPNDTPLRRDANRYISARLDNYHFYVRVGEALDWVDWGKSLYDSYHEYSERRTQNKFSWEMSRRDHVTNAGVSAGLSLTDNWILWNVVDAKLISPVVERGVGYLANRALPFLFPELSVPYYFVDAISLGLSLKASSHLWDAAKPYVWEPIISRFFPDEPTNASASNGWKGINVTLNFEPQYQEPSKVQRSVLVSEIIPEQQVPNADAIHTFFMQPLQPVYRSLSLLLNPSQPNLFGMSKLWDIRENWSNINLPSNVAEHNPRLTLAALYKEFEQSLQRPRVHFIPPESSTHNVSQNHSISLEWNWVSRPISYQGPSNYGTNYSPQTGFGDGGSQANERVIVSPGISIDRWLKGGALLAPTIGYSVSFELTEKGLFLYGSPTGLLIFLGGAAALYGATRLYDYISWYRLPEDKKALANFDYAVSGLDAVKRKSFWYWVTDIDATWSELRKESLHEMKHKAQEVLNMHPNDQGIQTKYRGVISAINNSNSSFEDDWCKGNFDRSNERYELDFEELKYTFVENLKSQKTADNESIVLTLMHNYPQKASTHALHALTQEVKNAALAMHEMDTAVKMARTTNQERPLYFFEDEQFKQRLRLYHNGSEEEKPHYAEEVKNVAMEQVQENANNTKYLHRLLFVAEEIKELVGNSTFQEQVRERLSKHLKENPNDFKIRGNLIEKYTDAGKFPSAKEEIQYIFDHAEDKSILAQAHLSRARVAICEKQMDVVVEHLEIAVNLDSKCAAACRCLGYFKLATDPQHALELFGQCLTLDPKDSFALLGSGNACLSLGEVARAKGFFRKIPATHPEYRIANEFLRKISTFENERMALFLGELGAYMLAYVASKLLRGNHLGNGWLAKGTHFAVRSSRLSSDVALSYGKSYVTTKLHGSDIYHKPWSKLGKLEKFDIYFYGFYKCMQALTFIYDQFYSSENPIVTNVVKGARFFEDNFFQLNFGKATLVVIYTQVSAYRNTGALAGFDKSVVSFGFAAGSLAAGMISNYYQNRRDRGERLPVGLHHYLAEDISSFAQPVLCVIPICIEHKDSLIKLGEYVQPVVEKAKDVAEAAWNMPYGHVVVIGAGIVAAGGGLYIGIRYRRARNVNTLLHNARADARDGQYDAGLAKCDEAKTWQANNPEIKKQYDKIVCLKNVHAKNLERAIELASTNIKEFPQDNEFLDIRGKAYLAQALEIRTKRVGVAEQYKNAAAEAASAAEAEASSEAKTTPNHIEVLAQELETLTKTEEALLSSAAKDYEGIVSNNNGDVGGHLQLASIRQLQNLKCLALKSYQDALAKLLQRQRHYLTIPATTLYNTTIKEVSEGKKSVEQAIEQTESAIKETRAAIDSHAKQIGDRIDAWQKSAQVSFENKTLAKTFGNLVKVISTETYQEREETLNTYFDQNHEQMTESNRSIFASNFNKSFDDDLKALETIQDILVEWDKLAEQRIEPLTQHYSNEEGHFKTALDNLKNQISDEQINELKFKLIKSADTLRQSVKDQLKAKIHELQENTRKQIDRFTLLKEKTSKRHDNHVLENSKKALSQMVLGLMGTTIALTMQSVYEWWSGKAEAKHKLRLQQIPLPDFTRLGGDGFKLPTAMDFQPQLTSFKQLQTGAHVANLSWVELDCVQRTKYHTSEATALPYKRLVKAHFQTMTEISSLQNSTKQLMWTELDSTREITSYNSLAAVYQGRVYPDTGLQSPSEQEEVVQQRTLIPIYQYSVRQAL